MRLPIIVGGNMLAFSCSPLLSPLLCAHHKSSCFSMVQGVTVEDGHLLDVNPSTGELIERVPVSTPAEVGVFEGTICGLGCNNDA